VKKVLKSIVLFISMELLLIPLYGIILVFIVFNDTGYTAHSLSEFLTVLIPIYLYLGATVVLLGIMFWIVRTRWNYQLSTALTYVILIFVIHVCIALAFVPYIMMSYLSNDVNMQYNPVYIKMEEKKEEYNKHLLETQMQEYQEYLSNEDAYSMIYHHNVDGVDFRIVMSKEDGLFYVQYNDGDNVFFKPLETVSLPTGDGEDGLHYFYDNTDVFFKPLGTVSLPPEGGSHDLKERVESNLHEVELYVFYGHPGQNHLPDKYYVHVADTDTTFGLGEHETSDVDIMIDGVRRGLNRYAQKELVGYMSLDVYDISYQNGQIMRSGSIGERVGWNIKGDNGESLSRSAENETVLDLSTLDWFQKGVTYTVYIDAHIDTLREYRPVSKAITFVYE